MKKILTFTALALTLSTTSYAIDGENTYGGDGKLTDVVVDSPTDGMCTATTPTDSFTFPCAVSSVEVDQPSAGNCTFDDGQGNEVEFPCEEDTNTEYQIIENAVDGICTLREVVGGAIISTFPCTPTHEPSELVANDTSVAVTNTGDDSQIHGVSVAISSGADNAMTLLPDGLMVNSPQCDRTENAIQFGAANGCLNEKPNLFMYNATTNQFSHGTGSYPAPIGIGRHIVNRQQLNVMDEIGGREYNTKFYREVNSSDGKIKNNINVVTDGAPGNTSPIWGVTTVVNPTAGSTDNTGIFTQCNLPDGNTWCASATFNARQVDGGATNNGLLSAEYNIVADGEDINDKRYGSDYIVKNFSGDGATTTAAAAMIVRSQEGDIDKAIWEKVLEVRDGFTENLIQAVNKVVLGATVGDEVEWTTYKQFTSDAPTPAVDEYKVANYRSATDESCWRTSKLEGGVQKAALEYCEDNLNLVTPEVQINGVPLVAHDPATLSSPLGSVNIATTQQDFDIDVKVSSDADNITILGTDGGIYTPAPVDDVDWVKQSDGSTPDAKGNTIETDNNAKINADGDALNLEAITATSTDTGMVIRGARNSQTYNTDVLNSYVDFDNRDQDNVAGDTVYSQARIGSGMESSEGLDGYFRVETNDGTGLAPQLDVRGDGDVRLHSYPNTRDDGAPTNLLYTTANGTVQSTLVSALASDVFRNITTNQPAVSFTEDIKHDGSFQIGNTMAVIISDSGSIASEPDVLMSVQGLLASESNQYYVADHDNSAANAVHTFAFNGNIDGSQKNALSINENGTHTIHDYPSTRIDTSAANNFLYTTAGGNLQSGDVQDLIDSSVWNELVSGDPANSTTQNIMRAGDVVIGGTNQTSLLPFSLRGIGSELKVFGDTTTTGSVEIGGDIYFDFDASGGTTTVYSTRFNDGAGNFHRYWNTEGDISPTYISNGVAFEEEVSTFQGSSSTNDFAMWYAGAGVAGDPITFSIGYSLDPDTGNFGIGTGSATERLDISGGDVRLRDYPETRNDISTNVPDNFLYTDNTGRVKSVKRSDLFVDFSHGTVQTGINNTYTPLFLSTSPKPGAVAEEALPASGTNTDILINVAGFYRIDYGVSMQHDTNSPPRTTSQVCLQRSTNGGTTWSNILRSCAFGYHRSGSGSLNNDDDRDTVTRGFSLSLGVNDRVRLVARKIASGDANLETVANEVNLMLDYKGQ